MEMSSLAYEVGFSVTFFA